MSELTTTKTAKRVQLRRLDEMTPEERAEALAYNATSSSVAASAVMDAFKKNTFPDVGPDDATLAIAQRVAKIKGGDLGDIEEMLFAQASALQTAFVSLARRATAQEYVQNYQAFMNLSLKAQNQSRAALEALIELKQPRQPVFAKQVNQASGPQQVNNYGNAQEQEKPESTRNPAESPAPLAEEAGGFCQPLKGVKVASRVKDGKVTGRVDHPKVTPRVRARGKAEPAKRTIEG